MRCYRVRTNGRAVPAVERDGRLVSADWSVGKTPIAAGEILGRPEDLKLAAPLAPGKIVAIGLNYRDHIEEVGEDAPGAPLVFAKFPSSVTGPSDPVFIDEALTSQVDWEVELGVVIGRRMDSIPEDEALEGVFGYTVVNDVSARDLQFSDGQWVRGKSLDSFCPMGPCIVTREDLPDPQHLALRTRINGETVQDASSESMIFSVAELLAYCSRSFTLEPGDLLLTGTPWGCGAFMDPPRSLRPGDLMETEIEGIGTLRNRIRGGRDRE